MAVITGATQDSYPSEPVLAWDLHNLYAQEITILVSNTGDTNSLDYVVSSKVDENGSDKIEETTGTLAPGESAMVKLNYPRNYIEVNVKSTSAGAFTSFEIQTSYERGALP